MSDIQQVRVYNSPVSDIINDNFSIVITDSVASDNGQSISNFMRNRNLTSAWITTESNDSANTMIECIISDTSTVSDIFLVVHNFKDFDIDYFDGVAWVNIASVTGNIDDFYHAELTTPVITTKVRVIIYSTIIADSDKILTRLIITSKMGVGQFSSWPVVKNSTQGLIKKDSVMLSGKHRISQSVGSYSVRLDWKGVTTQDDVDIIEQMFLGRKSFLLWISGGSETQFRFKITGYRRKDFYTVKPRKDYIADFYKGIYSAMLTQGIDLVEVVD